MNWKNSKLNDDASFVHLIKFCHYSQINFSKRRPKFSHQTLAPI